MISHRYQCIFVHIPKCGGTSLENMIWPPVSERTREDLWMGLDSPQMNKYQTGGLQHLYARNIREEVGEQVFERYFKFAIVRNPWDKAVSQYTYIKNRPDLRRYIGLLPWHSFSTYLKKTMRKKHVQWAPQVDFLKSTNGELIVDYIGALETIEQDVDYIMNTLDIEYIKIPHEKKSKRGDYRSYYNDKTAELVAAHYADDISEFGYTFD